MCSSDLFPSHDSIPGGDHSHVMTHGHTLSIASEGHTHVMTHGHTLSISGDGNAETTVKNISVNFFIVYKEVVSVDTDKVNDLWDFMQLVKNNFFNADCTKAIPYGNGLYATDDIASISNMVLDKEEY